MGLWNDTKKETGYDNISDYSARKAIRAKFVKAAIDQGYSEEDAVSALTNYDAFDKERAESQNRSDVQSPQWEAERAKMAAQGYEGNSKLPPERALKDVQFNKMLPEAKDMTDEQVRASVAGNPFRKNPIDLGFRESPIGQFLNYGAMPENAKGIVNEEINKERGEYEDELKKKSRGMRVLSRSGEMLGNIAGSPTTYAAPALPALAGIKGLGALTIPLYGMVQGAESAAADDALDRDPNYAERVLIGGASSFLGGKLGERIGKAVGDVAERTAAKYVPKISGQIGSVAENTGRVAGMGVGGSIPQIARDVVEGESEGTIDRALDNLLAQSIHGIPQVAGSMKTARGVHGGLPDSYVKTIVDYDNSGRLKLSDPKETLKSIIGAFHDSESATRRENTVKDAMVAGAGKLGEVAVDTNARALWELNRLAKTERDAIIQAYQKNGVKKGDVLDAMNKGTIPLPAAEQAANRIKALPTEEQRAIRNANKMLEGVYKDLSITEGEVLNKYATAKNLLNIKARVPEYILPRGETVEKMQKLVSDVDSHPALSKIPEKANQLFALNKEILDRKYAAGELPEADYNALVASGDNLGVQHILPKEPMRLFGDKKNGTSSRDEIKYIGTGSSLPINMDVGAVTHNRIVREQMAHAINSAYEPLHQMASEGRFGRILNDGETPNNGHSSITYISNGEKVGIEVPDWFKASIEKMPVKNEFLRLLSILTGSASTRALAVGINPEFALANIPRDFMRYYRMMAAGDKVSSPMEIAKTFINANPLVYSIKMLKNMAVTAKDVATEKGIYEDAIQNNALRGRWTRDIANNPYEDKAHPISAVYHKAQDILGKPGTISEDLLRVSAYKMLIDKGFTPERAGELTGGFLDYNRSGTLTKVLDAITPFVNVAIQAPRADIRMARKYPLSYASRVLWGLGIFGAVAALKYQDGVGVTDQESADQRTNYEMIPAWTDDKNRTAFIRVPLDQQDRFTAAVADSIIRISKGIPVDWERVKKAANDLALISNIYGIAKGGGAGRAINAVSDNVNWDDYRQVKLYNGPEPKEGARHEAFDPVKDSEALRVLTGVLYNMTGGHVDVQPAMLEYAIGQYVPSSMLSNTAGTAVKALSGDTDKINVSNFPVTRKFFALSDPEKPWRDAAKDPSRKKSVQQLRDYRERRKASQIKDIDEYIRFMTGWADGEKNPNRIIQIYREMNEGIRDRAVGTDLRFKSFLQNNVDPSAYEDVAREYERIHGRNPVNADPNLIRRMNEERAYEDEDTDE